MKKNNSNKTLIRVVCCLVGTAIVATGGIIVSTAIVRDRHRTHTKPTISTVASELSSTTPTVIEQATTMPTVKPTEKPTEKPTVKPTVNPTVKPTVKPTVNPTVKPTTPPTEEPTVEPTTPGVIEITDCGIDLAKAERIAGFQFKVHEASNFSVYADSTKIKHIVKLSAGVDKTYVKTSDLSYAESYKKCSDAKNYTKFDSEENPYANVMVNVTKNGKFSDAYFSDGEFAYSIHFDMPVDNDLLVSELATIFVLN